MFTDNGPGAAHQCLRDFLIDHAAALPAELETCLRANAAEMSPAAALTSASERLYAGLTELTIDAAVRDPALQCLGELTTRCSNGQWYGKGLRWSQIADWAAYELTAIGTAPPVPDVDPAFSFIPPAPLDPLV